MTNVCHIGSVTDQQSREQVPVEIGRNRQDELHFSFRGVAWAPEPGEFRRLQRVLQRIRRRIDFAARKGQPAKGASVQVGPFTVGLNDDSVWFIGTPRRFVYMDQNSLAWMLEAFRLTLAPPSRIVQAAVIPDPEMPPSWSL